MGNRSPPLSLGIKALEPRAAGEHRGRRHSWPQLADHSFRDPLPGAIHRARKAGVGGRVAALRRGPSSAVPTGATSCHVASEESLGHLPSYTATGVGGRWAHGRSSGCWGRGVMDMDSPLLLAAVVTLEQRYPEPSLIFSRPSSSERPDAWARATPGGVMVTRGPADLPVVHACTPP